jgi:ABC-2 type transport system ATP-binding protein
MHIIEVENLSKSYDDLSVLQGLTLRVARGEVYGLLGPNGSGKSTLLHLLLGFLQPSGGRLRVLGKTNLEKIRGRIGYLPERMRYHLNYSAREYLRFLGQFNDMREARLRTRIDEELERVGLSAVANRRLKTFSKGMLQRLGIAQALLDQPELLLIDEPTSGLDPAGQQEVLELLSEVRARGQTILLCTHYLDEIEYLCDRVGILAGGQIATESDVAQLQGPGTSIAIRVDRLAPELQERLNRISPAVRCENHTIVLRPNNQPLQAAVLRVLLDEGIAILTLEPLERPLERLYLQAVRGATADITTALPAGLLEPKSDESSNLAPRRRSGEGDTLLNELLHRDKKSAANGSAVQQDEAADEAATED